MTFPNTVLLFGSTSATGQMLTSALHAAGAEVHGIVSPDSSHKDVPKSCGCTKVHVVDLCNLESLKDERIVTNERGVPYDCVIYCASAHTLADVSSGEKKHKEDLVDFEACCKIAELCAKVHDKVRKVPRFVHIAPVNFLKDMTGLNADLAKQYDEDTQHWIHCCAKADSVIKRMSQQLIYTVVRCGFIVDAEPTGKITVFARTSPPEYLKEHKTITRQDLVNTLVEVLKTDKTKGRFLQIVNDGVPIAEAIDNIGIAI